MRKEIIMLEFRKAKIFDVNEIVRLEENNFSSERYTEKMINDILKNDDNDYILVAEDSNEILGYIIYREQDEYIDIFKICVSEKYRNKKIGTGLIQYLEKYVHKKRLILEVRSDNKGAIVFYEKNHFKRIHIKKNYYENPISDAYIYEKEL